jgi:hypothetical protein
MNLRRASSSVLVVSLLLGQPALTSPAHAETADWSGTVTLRADRSEVTTDDPWVVLTAEASSPVPGSWRISIYGQSGSLTRKVAECVE